jgi:glycine/D-amino acid oxidase-like deaminating enzyme
VSLSGRTVTQNKVAEVGLGLVGVRTELQARVQSSPSDAYLIGIRHPEAENVWIVGGGSGHGFKHGPVIGEMLADAVLGSKEPPTEMGLGRLLRGTPS